MNDRFHVLGKIMKKLQGRTIIHSQIDKLAQIGAGSTLTHVKMGKYSYCGYNCEIGYAEIGNFCSISHETKIGGGRHAVDWVSTSPVFCKGKNVLKTNFANHEFEPYAKTVIGNDVWIGRNALIRAGVTIDDGAIVGMGSVVTKNIGPFEIWAGNPARLIRKRFDDETIQNLIVIAWWDMSDIEIEKLGGKFNEVVGFVREVTK